MRTGIKEEEINNIMNHTRSGRPVGRESFIVKWNGNLIALQDIYIKAERNAKEGKNQ